MLIKRLTHERRERDNRRIALEKQLLLKQKTDLEARDRLKEEENKRKDDEKKRFHEETIQKLQEKENQRRK